MRLISEGLQAGRSGCWIGRLPGTDVSLGVPQTRFMRFTPGPTHEVLPELEPLNAVLPHRLALALETEHPAAFDLLSPGDRKVGNRLYAAALRDLAAVDKDAAADACGWSLRQVDRAVADGRRLWNRMAGWPWFHFADGVLPPHWRTSQIAPLPAAALATWHTGMFHVPAG